MHRCTIGYVKPSRRRLLTSFILTGRLILPMSSASIADTSTHGHISSGYSSGKDHHLNKLMVFLVEKRRRKPKSPIKWFLFRILWGPCNSKARGHFKPKYILIPFGAMWGVTRFQVSREYYYWRENHLRSSFRSDVATTPFVRNVPQTFHARTLSRVDLCISFHLSI